MEAIEDPMNLIEAAAYFLSDEKFWPASDIPREQVQKVITTFVSYACDYELKQEMKKINPGAAEKLCPERRKTYQ